MQTEFHESRFQLAAGPPSIMDPEIVILASGSNAHGQLANGTTDDAHVFTPCRFSGYPDGLLPSNTTQVLQIASGANHVVVLLERRVDAVPMLELWGCGDGSRGQLGPAFTNSAQHEGSKSTSVFKPINLFLHRHGLQGYGCRLVAASWETTYAVLSCAEKGDVLVSFGADDFGDLGIGGIKHGKYAMGTVHVVKFDHITVHGIPLESNDIVVESLNAGPHHIVAQLKRSLKLDYPQYITVGWGTSRHDQLGKIPATSARPARFVALPRVIAVGVAEDRVISAGLGNQHTVLLHASGRVTCLGSDRKHQLRGIASQKDVRSLGCTWNGTYIVTDPEGVSHIVATGSHSKGQLGRITPSSLMDTEGTSSVQFCFTSSTHHLENIACGSEHVLSLFTVARSTSEVANDVDTEVWGWGWNEHGNLGVGMTDDVILPVKIWPSTSTDEKKIGRERAVGIWAGCGTSWIIVVY